MGAPIDWFALEPAIARSNAVGVARRAPHPRAAPRPAAAMRGRTPPVPGPVHLADAEIARP